ncbi:hypothetical protein [Halopelagius fulvigenes]|uniref:Uncharacterized protein n=1 Tax=Halopelagius fulvigenes TaxID=1198324 RepID=A0ABD5U7X5_9EURY
MRTHSVTTPSRRAFLTVTGRSPVGRRALLVAAFGSAGVAATAAR